MLVEVFSHILKFDTISLVATTDIYSLPNEVLELYRSIRYCAIITKLSHILASKERQPAQFIVSEKDAELAALQSAVRHFSTPSWAMQLGEIYYTITRHEKIIGGTLRISKDYLMIVAFDVHTRNFDKIIMQKIMPLLELVRSSPTQESQA